MSFTARTITDKTHAELKALASLHTSFDAFLHDVERLAEKMWHNAKSQNETDQSVQPTPAPYGVGGLVPPAPAQSKTDAQQAAIDDGTAARNDSASNGGDGDFQPSEPASPGPDVASPPEQTLVGVPPAEDGSQPAQDVGVVVSPNPDQGTPVPVQESHPA